MLLPFYLLKTRFTLFRIQMNEKVSTHFWDQCVITFSILYVLTREILYSSCVFYFNGNRNELINLRSQFYVKITSVCVTDSFLVRYVRHDVS